MSDKLLMTRAYAACCSDDARALTNVLKSCKGNVSEFVNGVFHTQESDCATLVSVCATKGSVECLKTLLRHNADPFGCGEMVMVPSPLSLSAINGHQECFELLLEAGADPNSRLKNETVLRLVLSSSKFSPDAVVDMLDMLIARGVDVNETYNGEEDSSPLLVAAFRGQIGAVKRLIRANVDVNIKSSSSNITPIFLAADRNNAPLLVELLREGASVGARDKRGMMALHLPPSSPRGPRRSHDARAGISPSLDTAGH